MSDDIKFGLSIIVGGIVALVLCIVVFFGVSAFGKSFSRSQRLKSANNQVEVTHIEERTAKEKAKIVFAEIETTQAERKKRVVEAEGLAEAQKLIDHTLTPLYVQHEAIQAQERIATSGSNNTVIYVPAGTNGTPTITAEAGKGK